MGDRGTGLASGGCFFVIGVSSKQNRIRMKRGKAWAINKEICPDSTNASDGMRRVGL